MSILNNNKKQFNLPAYINIPFFLYQDNRLEKPSMLIAGFFYSLYTAGLKITASKDYVCELVGIKKSQYFFILNQLESFGYIKRSGFTNRKKIQWAYSPKYEIIVDETDTSPVDRTSVQELNKKPVQELNTSPLDRTQLVRSSGLPTIDNNKDYKTTTTVPTPVSENENLSSSSFFSSKQKTELLSYKLLNDNRSDELFLAHCTHHVQNQDSQRSKFQRFTGLRNLITKLYETNEPFSAQGFNKTLESKETEIKIPTREDFENYKRCVAGYDWVGAWMQKNKQG